MIVVEAGPVVRPNDMVKEAGFTLAKYFWDAGLRTTMGGNVIMPTMQPRVLGGGSVFNSAICLRIPDFALNRWNRDHGVGITPDDLAPHFESVEKFMKVKVTNPAVMGRRNELFAEGCEKVGIVATPIYRNEEGCKGSSECLTGCPNHAKQSMDLRGVPEIVALGGRVYTSVHVDKLIMDGDRARGIEGYIVNPNGQTRTFPVKLRARKAVILAAGALASPIIAMKSGMNQKVIGGALQFHPSTAMMGVFDEEVHPWSGATQGFHSLSYIEQGIKLESLWAIPSLLSFRFPGVGPEFVKLLTEYRHMACWDAWTSGEDSVGRIRMGPTGKGVISYTVGNADMKRLQFAMVKLAEMFFATGARRVLHGLSGLPPEINKASEIDLIRNIKMTPQSMMVGSNHVFGGMIMGSDPRRHAVDNRGAVYGVKDLYIADTGIFPSSPAVNPMLTIMAFADRFGQQIADRHA